MARRMLADLLWEAANGRLCSGSDRFRSPYTCDAVTGASIYSGVPEGRVFSFLRRIGFPKNAVERCDLFDDFDYGEQRQGVRYMWLLLAMHVAADEGIEV